MLKQRVMTALILIPIFVIAVLKLSAGAFCVLTALLVLWGAWEWSLFLKVVRFPHCFIYPGIILLVLIGALMFPVIWILALAAMAWVLALILVLIYPKGSAVWGQGFGYRAIMGILVLIPCWVAVNYIRGKAEGPSLLLYLFVLIWGADIAAYFVGIQWGRHKLCPRVSPKKSWEGLGGALVVTGLIAFCASFLFHISSSEWPWVLILSLITVLFSVLGDLFESMLKRNVGLKDSGQLLPGHGGLLDRIDSLTAAAPIFALGITWLGRYF